MTGRVFVSRLAGEELKDYVRRSGREVIEVADEPRLGAGVATHADLVMCKTGGGLIHRGRAALGPDYPADARYCALFLDKYLVHRLDVTAPELLARARELGLEAVNVRQGYARCSALPVDGGAVITSDGGIASALIKFTDVKVLKVAPGHVLLPGFETGFIGGAAGRVGDEILFNGDLSRHPDFPRIRQFIEEHGLGVKWFGSYPLTDVGSVIEE